MTTDRLPADVIAADRALSPRQRPTPDPVELTDEEVQRIVLERFEWQRRADEERTRRREREFAAIDMLRSWRKAHDARNDVIRAARDAGLSVKRIHELTGIARTTIDRLLNDGS
jgi:hypothetical protein